MHEFVEGMGQGTLPIERFKAYLVQDYLYLVRSHVVHAFEGSFFLTNFIPAGPVCSQ
jgi:thiaminase